MSNRSDFSRRAFVVGAATAAAAAVPTPSPAASPAPAMLTPAQVAEVRRLSAKVPFHFDLPGFNAVLRRPFDHRQVVAATTYQSGAYALDHMQRSIESYADPLGFAAGTGTFHAACVMYAGDSPLLALDDAMYAKYPIAVVFEREMNPGNPVYAERAKGMRTNYSGPQYRQLVADHGASFFVCNNALSGLAYEIAQAIAPQGTPVARDQVVSIHDEMVEHFLPGTMLVPNGVGALNALQEQRFTFLPG
jgi:hypothetical protein